MRDIWISIDQGYDLPLENKFFNFKFKKIFYGYTPAVKKVHLCPLKKDNI